MEIQKSKNDKDCTKRMKSRNSIQIESVWIQKPNTNCIQKYRICIQNKRVGTKKKGLYTTPTQQEADQAFITTPTENPGADAAFSSSSPPI